LIHEEYGRRLDETAREYLSQIVAGATRMNRLIEDILEQFCPVERQMN
jgi:signal transduction histidine kinase